MNFETIHKIYIIGICGTAMASLAGLLKQKGYTVCGSDSDVYPPMSTQLQELGIELYSGYKAENLHNAKPDLVIPGNAVPRGNAEVEELLNSRIPYFSISESMREFFLREKHSIVIAGTHGKTTTTSLASWVLESAQQNPSFLVGGIPLNFKKSFQWNELGAYFVIEGDEYDTGFMDRRPKFVQYLPEFVILNPVEFDHADIYADLAAVENAFWQMIKVVPGNGTIIVNRDSETAFRLAKRGYSNVVSFGFHPESDYRVDAVEWEEGRVTFRLNGIRYEHLRMFGRHNVANAAAVAVLAEKLGLSQEEIQRAFSAFEGVKRRMELRGEVNGIRVYDDFAHHPTAIHTTLEGVRLAYPERRVWGIFEPRSWSSRRNVFQNQFADAFGFADMAIIAGVFEPEKLPEEVRLDPEKLVSEIARKGTRAYYIDSNDEIIRFVKREARVGDCLVLMSNGSFEGLHEKLLEGLR
ncbi:MAG: UDP-N-acetylmuramate:L-alanyl-gamma-D-glutamyl-meso-diaminopimelate ligase [Acidobacteria bacterium]|nr:MAG: UDP-N-acetylmuramate:L-alanyl-gamma-D-glutamyl-meso-diaminopimelate ligase [Acidobacteriota bacterium]